jgi:Acetylornithine deacetylase/Succinyl-diaminopimelate desuccinylase and related deacylases
MDEDNLLSLVKKLISIPSVYYQENDIIDFCNLWLSNKDLNPKVMNYNETKVIGYSGKNIICVVDSGKPGITVMLNGHLDTVPICNGWTTNPFIPTEVEDRLYGLGAVDMKSGSAIIMNVTNYLDKHKDLWSGKLILTLVTDEEGPYGLGADALINKHVLPPIDVVISCEPSAAFSKKPFPVLCLGARGCFVYNIDFHGKAAHASTPEKGINAICEAAKFIDETKNVVLKEDPILGKGSFCVLKMNSDGGACSVPDEARVTIHRHIVTFEDEDYVINEARALIEKANIKIPYEISVRPEPSKGARYYKPYYVNKDNKYVNPFIETIKENNNGLINIDYFASIGDFNYFGTRLFDENGNNPATFIFGPKGDNFHAANEYVIVDTIINTRNTIIKYLEKIMK